MELEDVNQLEDVSKSAKLDFRYSPLVLGTRARPGAMQLIAVFQLHVVEQARSRPKGAASTAPDDPGVFVWRPQWSLMVPSRRGGRGAVQSGLW